MPGLMVTVGAITTVITTMTIRIMESTWGIREQFTDSCSFSWTRAQYLVDTELMRVTQSPWSSNVYIAIAETDLGLTYALRRPGLAAECFRAAVKAATIADRPDLLARAKELLAIVEE